MWLSSSQVSWPNSLAHIVAVRRPRDALHVAVAERPHRGPERIARRRVALGRESQDLAAQRIRILRGVPDLRVTRRDVQISVRPEGDPAAIVRAVARDAGEHRLGVAEAPRPRFARERHPHDTVVSGRAVVRVQPRAAASSGRSASPCRPDSPPETTPGTTPTVRSSPSSVSSRIVPLSRSEMSAPPPGERHDRPGRGETRREGRGLSRRTPPAVPCGRRRRCGWSTRRAGRNRLVRRRGRTAGHGERDREERSRDQTPDPRHDASAAASIAAMSILVMREHGLHRAVRTVGIRVADQFDQPVRHDLPGQAPPVLQPRTGLLLHRRRPSRHPSSGRPPPDRRTTRRARRPR